MSLDKKSLQSFVNKFWDDSILPTLIEYIKIPNKSPSFDPDWKKNGYMDKVLDMAKNWAEENLPEGATLTTKETVGRTPIILVDVPGKKEGNILMYGHLRIFQKKRKNSLKLAKNQMLLLQSHLKMTSHSLIG